MSRFSDVFLRK